MLLIPLKVLHVNYISTLYVALHATILLNTFRPKQSKEVQCSLDKVTDEQTNGKQSRDGRVLNC